MPLIIAQVVELVSDDYAIVDDGEGRPHGHYVRVHDVVDRARLKPSANVFLHASSSLAVLEDLPPDADAGAIVLSYSSRTVRGGVSCTTMLPGARH
jgi:ATP-dependent 26S proteasome regulatory subunit